MKLGLSLCMIVRDEAEMLPELLAAAAGLWDELCVVDTGSRDGTVALLEAAGARVVHRAWSGDFAAARNAGLTEARGDWILFLDADERPSPALVAAVRALVEGQDAGVGAATVTMRNRLPHGHERTSRLLRLFRNDPEIRFRCAIHEEVSTTVGEFLRRTGRRMLHLDGEVLHLGYVRDRAATRDKKARDTALLGRAVAEDPGDLYSWFKLLELARFWQDEALLRGTAARLAPLLTPGALAARPFGGELAVLLAEGLATDPAGALAVIDGLRGEVLPSAALCLRRAELCERLGRRDEAAAEFTRCFAFADQDGDRQLATVRPRLGLVRLALAAGDLTAACGHVDQALADNPRDPEALLAAIVIRRATGGREAVAAFAARHPASPELAAALAEEAALQRPPTLGQAQTLLAEGDVDGAADLAATLFPAQPAAGLGLLVCDLIRGRDSELQIELEEDEANVVLRGWVDALLRSGREDLLVPFRANAASVEPLFPWLPGYLSGPTAAR